MPNNIHSVIFRNYISVARTVMLCAFILLCGAGLRADATKTVSGKLRGVKDNILTVKKDGLTGSSTIDIEMDEHTKVTGQVAQGMHAKIKYREEASPGGKGEPRRIAIEIETRPDRATKDAKEVAAPSPPPKKDHP